MSPFLQFFTIVYDWVNIIQYLTMALATVLVLTPVKWNRKSVLIALMQLVAAFALETVFNMFLFVLSSQIRAINGLMYPTAHILTITVYSLLFCKFRPGNKFTISVLLCFIIIDVVELGAQLSRWLGGTFEVSFDWLILLSYALIVVFAVIISIYSIRDYSDIPADLSLMEVLTCGVSIVLIYAHIVYAELSEIRYDPYFCGILLGLYAISFGCYFLVRSACKERSARISLVKDNQLLKANNAMLRLSEESIHEIRSFRHEVKNQMTVIKTLMAQQRYGEAEEYLNKVYGTLDTTFFVLNCGNPIIDSVMNMEKTKAKAHGVTLQSAVSVPATLPFNGPDLCGLIANILDNAIEEVVRIQSTSPVNFELNVRGDALYLCCRNRTLKQEKYVRFVTEKEDPTAHGIGHNIVDRIVKNYGGYINYTIENGLFIVEAVLDMQYAKEEKKNEG